MKTLKPGRIARIKNKDRKMGASTHYNQFTIKSVDGKRYEIFLATDNELEKMKIRADKNKEDVLPMEVKRAGKFWQWRR